jgi:hypothetical protein
MQDGSQLSALVGNLLSEEGEDSNPEFEVETGFDPTVEPSTPAETGSTELEGETDFDPTTPTTEVAGATHRVKVDGEEIDVTYDELLKGYSRQAHFTREQQKLRQRERELQEADALVAALARDPKSTLHYLAQAYGVDFAQQVQRQMPQATPHQQPDFWEEDVDTTGGVDPAQQAMWARLQELEAFAAQQAATQRQQQTERQMSQLHERYGDFEDDAIYAHAVKYGIPDLEQAYASWAFHEQKAAQAAARETGDQQVRDSKRKASVVASGSSKQAGTVSDPPPPKGADFKTIALWGLKKAGLA